MKTVNSLIVKGESYDIEDLKARAKELIWNADSNMNHITNGGVYNISGERLNKNDNLPIENSNPGHTISARLIVLDSSISGNGDSQDKCVTQVLMLSNRTGEDGNAYVRTGSGASLSSLTWSKWGKLQTNIEVGQVTSLDGFIDNGMYSGVFTNGVSVFDTFVLIVINNYAVAAATGQSRSISQFKYSLNVGGYNQFQHRTGNGEEFIEWSEWKTFGEERLPIVDESQLDNIGGDMSQFLDAITNLGARYYTVTSTARKIVVGKMEIISDNAMHGVTQILKTHYLLNEDGTLNLLAHNHNEIYIYTRIWDRTSKSWSKWVEYKEDIRKSIQEIHEFLSSDFLEQTYAYGVEWDTAVTTPECTRIGSMNLHRSLPVQSGMRGCLLNDNGVVVEYLPANDWTTAVRDGSKGQVMVEIPKHYRKFVTDGTKRQVWLSMMPLAGYHEVPKAYVGAYEAALDRTNLMLASVANTTDQYRGGDNTADWDGTYRSLLGKPMTNERVGQHITYARKRKANSFEWNAMTYDAYKTITWLYVVEYATRNSQAPYNAQPTNEGFKQGGLGAGVTTLDNTTLNNYNLRNPIIDCGTSDSLGNNTGEVEYTMPTEYSAAGVVVKVNRYRGIEMPFGHTNCCLDGIAYVYENPLADYADVYVCSNPELFYKDIRDFSHLSNYKIVGQSINTKGNEWYLKDILFGDNGEIIPTLYSGGSNTNYCDTVNMMSAAGTPSGTRYVNVGGHNTAGAASGLFFQSIAYNGYYLVDRRVGTRLCFIPNNK